MSAWGRIGGGLIFGLVAVLLTVRAEAQNYFTQASGDWTVTGNWNPAYPNSGTQAAIGSGSPGVSPATAAIHAGDTAACSLLRIGYNGTGKIGTLTIDGGQLTAGAANVGESAGAIGTINQSAGVCNPGTVMFMAQGAGSTGIYNLANAVLTNTDVRVSVGYGELNISGSSIYYARNAGQSEFGNASSTGIVSQTGGDVKTASGNHLLYIGNGVGGRGVYNISGGTLANVQMRLGRVAGGRGELNISGSAYVQPIDLFIGGASGGTGVVTQTGGTVNGIIPSVFWLPNAAGALGSYDISGGNLTNMDIRVLAGGIGNLTISGSANLVGRSGGQSEFGNANSTGTVTQTGGTWNMNQYLFMGVGAGGLGVYNISGGTLSNVTSMRIGYTGGRGELNISGSALVKSSSAFYIPQSANCTGVVTQTGGVVDGNSQDFYLAEGAPSYGRYDISGGTVSNFNIFYAGRSGQGTLNLSGTGLVRGTVTIGNSSGSTGTVNQTGGTLDVSGKTLTIGVSGVGRFVQSNGVCRAATLTMGANLGSVELWGTNRVFEVGSTLTVNTGCTITNHVQGYSGGLDITNSAATPTMNGKIHVAFENDPKAVGAYWGLRWGGNHTNDFATWRTGGNLTVATNALSSYWQPKVGLFYDGTNSFVGIQNVTSVTHGTLFMVE